MAHNRKMTVAEMILALQRLDQDATVVFNIMQGNKVYGVEQLRLDVNEHFGIERPDERFPHIKSTYGGACVNLWLPDGAYLVQRKK